MCVTEQSLGPGKWSLTFFKNGNFEVKIQYKPCFGFFNFYVLLLVRHDAHSNHSHFFFCWGRRGDVNWTFWWPDRIIIGMVADIHHKVAYLLFNKENEKLWWELAGIIWFIHYWKPATKLRKSGVFPTLGAQDLLEILISHDYSAPCCQGEATMWY